MRRHRQCVEFNPKPTSLLDRHPSLLTLNSTRNHARAGDTYGRSACRTAACCHPCCRCLRLRPADGHRRGRHACRLKAYRREIIDPKIAQHRGRIVKLRATACLVEFASAVDAVRCAIDIQRAMPARNADMPPEKRIEIRIGINVGDIIIDDEDIFGDGVNVAARLEGIAEPGGICISEDRSSAGERRGGSRIRRSWRAEPQEHRTAGTGLSHRA